MSGFWDQNKLLIILNFHYYYYRQKYENTKNLYYFKLEIIFRKIH